MANSSTTQWINPENEHFIVWMRTAGLSNFRKLWGHIDTPLINGTYTFTVDNFYNPKTFAGHKNIVLSTSGITHPYIIRSIRGQELLPVHCLHSCGSYMHPDRGSILHKKEGSWRRVRREERYLIKYLSKISIALFTF